MKPDAENKVEYEVRSAKIGQLEAYLNARAASGWRLASVIPELDLGSTDGFVVILAREAQ